MLLTSVHVVEQHLISMASLQLRLPHMVVCVDEARAAYLVGAVDNDGVRVGGGCVEIHADVDDLVAVDEDVGLGGYDSVVGVVEEHSSVT